MNIKILDPKAKKVIKDLVEMNLICIVENEKSENDLNSILKDLRKNSNDSLSMKEIEEEVEYVRKKRYYEKKLKVIFDTNIWISYLIKEDFKILDKYINNNR